MSPRDRRAGPAESRDHGAGRARPQKRRGMVKIRLRRVGKAKQASYRVVVADARSPRDGRIIEAIGHYNPRTDPSTIEIDDDRLQHWLARGAQPTNTVKQLMKAR